MTETISQQKEFVFISVDGKQTKNHAISPPENLKVEFPPKFSDSELGRTHDKKGSGKSKKPPNAFILFRKKYVESLHRLGHHDAMKKVSGWARDAWNKLSQAEKDQYEQYANRAASLYQEWEIRNPQPINRNNNRIRQSNNNNTATRKRKNLQRGHGQNPNSISLNSNSTRQISTPTIHQMPAHFVSPKSSPESIFEILPDYDNTRNYNDQPILTEPFPTFHYYPEIIYDTSSIIPDYFVNIEDSYSVPPLAEIQSTNNQFYDLDYYLSNSKINFL
ncbi:uncharacterized protein OCT59_007460 [Rhizophagus irregularis]|uniref:MATA-HMG n=4 Tax=Rhizophagus irregularis TaxID=588596 RepID=A0A1B1EUJ1_9GLOM|nr:hypothetical protein GLOIN_2v1525554 [Rhizophagus irregularis DAOM 181602=DAOM 197198]ANQ32491.1 MATA-HMG [Rhizophagus irregularis]EXX50637.1 hypothetical protein RirG_268880 [Rhizophagus irregularis DAOM 197198w]ANQ32493.1 MATA-HMG [Rhizophagus irregularis]ANQ32494.1 MATA-HMG [Rhizophagus irregularis]ANQ32495.1 MATA-HMG [Rhizophagus irregularis]|eukprot:XP_025186600.1 hypothetical protein GLOIN_2v1525554 [Rhizophagus irregularis DAOM 181602=DAOM 197198]